MTRILLGANAAMAWATYIAEQPALTALNLFACLLCLWMVYHERSE